ncbi:MAG: carboxymuconolactone decarboxylase family protein [Gammaproteobacteria bacterium]|nr:MAG: carboxymuconolactone decarboxylase family protein [Gammaproteobacteria bacterium]
MSNFPDHTLETAPEESRPFMETTRQVYGMIPNLMAKMATSPAIAEAYLTVGGIFDKTSLTPVERQIVLLTVSHFNRCTYCVGAHSVIADMQEVPEEITNAIRNDVPIRDEKLQALRSFVVRMMDSRGWVSDDELDAFYAAGYGQEQVLDVIVGIAMKTMSNYTNHVAGTELDEAFAHRAWS